MSENNDARLPQAIPPNDVDGLMLWLRMLYQVVRRQEQTIKAMQDRIKELEDNQNG